MTEHGENQLLSSLSIVHCPLSISCPTLPPVPSPHKKYWLSVTKPNPQTSLFPSGKGLRSRTGASAERRRPTLAELGENRHPTQSIASTPPPVRLAPALRFTNTVQKGSS